MKKLKRWFSLAFCVIFAAVCTNLPRLMTAVYADSVPQIRKVSIASANVMVQPALFSAVSDGKANIESASGFSYAGYEVNNSKIAVAPQAAKTSDKVVVSYNRIGIIKDGSRMKTVSARITFTDFQKGTGLGDNLSDKYPGIITSPSRSAIQLHNNFWTGFFLHNIAAVNMKMEFFSDGEKLSLKNANIGFYSLNPTVSGEPLEGVALRTDKSYTVSLTDNTIVTYGFEEGMYKFQGARNTTAWEDKIGGKNFECSAVIFGNPEETPVFTMLSKSGSYWFAPKIGVSFNPVIPKKPEKTVTHYLQDGKTILEKEVREISHAQSGDILEFHINQQIEDTNTDSSVLYKSFSIEDTVPDRTEYIVGSAKVYSNGNDISDAYNVIYDAGNRLLKATAKNVSLSAGANKSLTYTGEVITLSFQVSVSQTAVSHMILNTGTARINGESFSSNDVKVNVDPPPEKKIRLGSKEVTGSTGAKTGDEISYIIRQNMTDLSAHHMHYQSFAVTDMIPKEVTISGIIASVVKNGSRKILTSDQYHVTKSAQNSGTQLNVAIDPSYLAATPVSGGSFELVVTGEINDRLVYGTTFTNTAEVRINGESAVSNEVRTESLGEARLRINKSADKIRYRLGDTITYTITVTDQGAAASNVIIEDEITEGSVVNVTSLKKDGTAIPLNASNLKIETDRKRFTVTTKQNLEPGSTFVLEYTVSTEGVDASQLPRIKNTACASADNAGKVRVTKSLGPEAPCEVEVTKTADKETYRPEDQKISYTICCRQLTPGGIANNVLLYDTLGALHTAYALDIQSLVVQKIGSSGAVLKQWSYAGGDMYDSYKNKGDIRSAVFVNTEHIGLDTFEDSMDITMREPLAYGESFVVTYDVMLNDAYETVQNRVSGIYSYAGGMAQFDDVIVEVPPFFGSLAIEKRADRAVYTPGDQISYTVEVWNPVENSFGIWFNLSDILRTEGGKIVAESLKGTGPFGDDIRILSQDDISYSTRHRYNVAKMNTADQRCVFTYKVDTAACTEDLVNTATVSNPEQNVVMEDSAVVRLKEVEVLYKTDGNGEISGIPSEKQLYGRNPSGSEEIPNQGYVFSGWMADSDVVLTDGSTIKSGTLMRSTDVKNVVLTQDRITFTAINVLMDIRITTHFVDRDNRELAVSVVEDYKYQSHYTTKPVEIYGYTQEDDSGNTEGTAVEDTDVYYIYAPAQVLLTIKHVDTQGNQLTTPEERTLHYLDSYTTSEKSFDRYVLKTRPSNAEGTIRTMEPVTVCYVYQLKSHELLIRKSDGKESFLQNAGFALYTDSAGKTLAEAYIDSQEKTKLTESNGTTDQNGVLHLYGLQPGSYYIKEVRAPSGYDLYPEMIQLDFSEDGSVLLRTKEEIKDITPENVQIEVLVEDKAFVSALPLAGSTGILRTEAGGLLMAAAGFLITIWMERRYRKSIEGKAGKK